MSAMIVVGVDGSAESARALEYAAAEAARRGARLRVVSVFSMPDYWMVPIGFAPPQVTVPPVEVLRSGAQEAAQRAVDELSAARPDLRIETIRGNVDTRLRKLDEGQFDAILLAVAGLRRLGWEDRISEIVPIETICPAVGQGALAVETREDDSRFDFLDHAPSRTAVDIDLHQRTGGHLLEHQLVGVQQEMMFGARDAGR